MSDDAKWMASFWIAAVIALLSLLLLAEKSTERDLACEAAFSVARSSSDSLSVLRQLGECGNVLEATR